MNWFYQMIFQKLLCAVIYKKIYIVNISSFCIVVGCGNKIETKSKKWIFESNMSPTRASTGVIFAFNVVDNYVDSNKLLSVFYLPDGTLWRHNNKYIYFYSSISRLTIVCRKTKSNCS